MTSLLAGIAVSFYLMPFLIHALGDRWYGIWALIGSITSYYALLDFGLTSAVTRFLTQALARAEKTSANAVIVTGLVIFGGIGALAFSISIAVALAGPWFFTDRGRGRGVSAGRADSRGGRRARVPLCRVQRGAGRPLSI